MGLDDVAKQGERASAVMSLAYSNWDNQIPAKFKVLSVWSTQIWISRWYVAVAVTVILYWTHNT